MLSYIIRRLIYMVIMLLALSIVSFIIIQLPPGDFLTLMVLQLEAQGVEDAEELVRGLEEEYGLNLPIYAQYWRWFSKLISGDAGRSFAYNMPVAKLVGDRIVLSMILSFMSMIVTYAIAIPIGIYSATHQYSVADYIVTFLGFIGLATPNFLLALVLMFFAFRYLGWSVGGLFSPDYLQAPWSLGKVWDLLKHLPVPIIVIATAGTAGMIRSWRALLLDELNKQYVITARAKGVSETKLLLKYPVRIVLIPTVSGIGGLLPRLISGAAITSIVVSLPTVGPLMLRAVLDQDMYLAGSLLMFLGALGLFGVLIADLLLGVVDPRIRIEKGRRR